MSTETKQEVTVATKARPDQEVAVASKPGTEIADTSPVQLFSPIREMEQIFDRLLPSMWMRRFPLDWPAWNGVAESMRNVRSPLLDVIDQDKAILIRVELPGVEKKNVDVSVSDHLLVVKASEKQALEKKEKGFVRREISRNDFYRSLALPDGLDTTKINAVLENGILEIVVPKAENAQRRSIEVK